MAELQIGDEEEEDDDEDLLDSECLNAASSSKDYGASGDTNTNDTDMNKSKSETVQLPAFPTLGVSLKVLTDLANACCVDTTTNFACHEIVRQRTVPHGWVDIPTIVDKGKGWYAHTYQNTRTKVEQSGAPAGTRSYAEMLRGTQLLADKVLVGNATHFVSHAWKYRFRDVVDALQVFDAQQESDSERFYWFDVCSVNQHSSQVMPQAWWGSTFRDTVMVLSPWMKPVPLTRAWCLWKLFCTEDTGADFSICLPPVSSRDSTHSVIVLHAFVPILFLCEAGGMESVKAVSMYNCACRRNKMHSNMHYAVTGMPRKTPLGRFACAMPRPATLSING